MARVYNSFNEVVALVADGKVGVIPTDTLYGVVAAASNVSAVESLYKLKSREKKPGTLVAASIDQIVELGLKKRYLTAVEAYWPGAVSIIIPTGPTLDYLHQGTYSLAVRIPANKQFREFLKQTGPLITSSANLPGKKPATTIKEAQKYFGDNVGFYMDGGTLKGEPSTIIRVVDDAVMVLREGAVKIDEETGRVLS